jgi:hypothetical protein
MRDLVGDSRRKERRDEAQRKLYSLALDQNHVLSAQQGGEGVLDVERNFELLSRELTADEYMRLINTRARLQDDIEKLLDALADNQDDIDALFRAIEAAGLLGRFMGEVPLQRNLRTAKGRETISTKVQRRWDALKPLVLKEAKFKRKGIPERALEAANELLRAKGVLKKEDKNISLRTFADDVSQILAENPE